MRGRKAKLARYEVIWIGNLALVSKIDPGSAETGHFEIKYGWVHTRSNAAHDILHQYVPVIERRIV
jgi:hypothetical protein